MKKTLLLTALILSIVCSVAVYAATETQKTEITADTFWNGGNSITRANSASFDAGTLPTQETSTFMTNYTSIGVGRFPRFQCYGTGYTADGTGTITASAVPEETGSSNIVFKITGDQQTILNDTTFTDAELADIGKHSIRFKLSSDVSSNGVVSLFVLSGNPANHKATLQENGIGVFISNGGAYINDVTTGEKVWFVPEGTLASDTWYTAETLIEIIVDGYIVQNATVKDESGVVIGKSGCYKVSTAKASDYTSGAAVNKFNLLQLGTENLGSGIVMLDDWKTYKVTDTPMRGTAAVTLVQDPDKAMRKVYKLETGVTLNSEQITDELVTVTSANPEINMAGKYSVSCDGTAIVVTMDETLPLETEFTIAIDPDVMLEMDGGYVAFNYAATAVINSLVQTFTTPSDSELFEVAIAADASTVSFSNISFDEREYIIIASRFDASGKYLETAAKYGTLGARAADGTPTTDSVAVPAFADAAAGDVIKVMVWDNWESMNFFAELRQVTVQ